uniref:Uncharacterized protein n=1 Tax=Romanomermis culicivorax TaxID=13658 RepID=A0A915JN15_ROMCU
MRSIGNCALFGTIWSFIQKIQTTCHHLRNIAIHEKTREVENAKKLTCEHENDLHSLLHEKKVRITTTENIVMEQPTKYHHERDFRREHPSDSKDCQKRIEWASALKCDQLPKEELKGQQPPTADSEQMIDK